MQSTSLPLVDHSPYVPLSAREVEMLGLLGRGMTNPEIADALHISLNTVKRHRANIYSKLGVGNRVEAATFAVTGRLAS